jgi:hypothetical protein
MCSLLQLPTKHKIGLCVAFTVRVWETNGVSSLRSSYIQRFLSSAVSPPLMAVEMWMFGSGLAYCYAQNTDLVQIFRCALFREMLHTEQVCAPPCVDFELDICLLVVMDLVTSAFTGMVGLCLTNNTTYYLMQRFSNFFQVGTTFINQNVLRTTLLLSPVKANCLRFSTVMCDTQFKSILFFLSFLD